MKTIIQRLICLICFGSILGCGLFTTKPTPIAITPTFLPSPTPLSVTTLPANESVALIDAAGLDFAEKRTIDVYQRISPSVVNITTQVLRRNFFFQAYPEEGSGSGFVLDQEGHIVTNHHVIDGAQTIEVSLGEELVFPAELVGSDAINDIAILKVDAPPNVFIPITLGTSDHLQVGQRAIAIGNPFGQFERTLTTGVISALDRRLTIDNDHEMRGLIQTDTAINRGNSGGPLLDSAGRVIGINTAIFSPTGTNTGIGFAIPVNTLKRILPDLLTLGYYRRPWLGIRYAYSLTPALSERLELPVEVGLLLVQLDDNSPLPELGIKGAQQEVILGNRRFYLGGDILQAINDVPVESLADLENLLETQHQLGDTITLTIIRDGRSEKYNVELGAEP